MILTIRVTATCPRPTTTGVRNGIDVDVTVFVSRSDASVRIWDGEVTLAPSPRDGDLIGYGNAPDHWVSGALLAAIGSLPDYAFRPILNLLSAIASKVAVKGDDATPPAPLVFEVDG